MSIQSDNPEHGLQFPGTFEISAMGAAGAGLDARVPEALEAAGLVVHRDRHRSRPSAKGNWVSVTYAFDAASRADYERAHEALRALPEVKWTL
jgi:putative lipoic acid-binding regulatory protein